MSRILPQWRLWPAIRKKISISRKSTYQLKEPKIRERQQESRACSSSCPNSLEGRIMEKKWWSDTWHKARLYDLWPIQYAGFFFFPNTNTSQFPLVFDEILIKSWEKSILLLLWCSLRVATASFLILFLSHPVFLSPAGEERNYPPNCPPFHCEKLEDIVQYLKSRWSISNPVKLNTHGEKDFGIIEGDLLISFWVTLHAACLHRSFFSRLLVLQQCPSKWVYTTCSVLGSVSSFAPL